MSRQPNTNPFSPELPPHRPADVYDPNPFPLSPTEGNPWQQSHSYIPPPPGSVRMPEPQVNGVPVAHSQGGSWGGSSVSGGGHTNAWDESVGSTDNSAGYRSHDPSQGSSSFNPNTAPEVRQNAWDDDRTGTPSETPKPQPQTVPLPSPYRFAGTRYASQEDPSNGDETHKNNSTNVQLPPVVPVDMSSRRRDDGKPYMGGARQKPSVKRVYLRVVQLLAAVGRFGFQIGATPFAGVPIPKTFNLVPFYLLYVAAWLSIILSFIFIYVYLSRRFGRGNKIKRPILILLDLIMAVVWGAGVISEIITNQCPPGGLNHWCDFYNTAIFWGALEFVLYVVALIWDIVGCCLGNRRNS